jgi:hypothetical protein
MASGKMDYFSQKLDDQVLAGVAYAFPTSIDIGLYTATPSHTNGSGTEVSGGSYARLQETCNTTNFPSIASGQVITNNVTFAFVTSTASWGTVTGVEVFEHGNNNGLYFGDLTANQAVNTNNIFQFTAGNFSLTET